ncbi:hypothetical protein GCM10025882_26640 [Acinetobacter gyllenbergii]|nr:hypothetical protein NG55_01160 [Acinetobacter gyllenbergii]GMA12239.1 hypothetical protein GCM10025882_26640 [Acinetobacter gyllenbergii]
MTIVKPQGAFSTFKSSVIYHVGPITRSTKIFMLKYVQKPLIEALLLNTFKPLNNDKTFD